MSGAPVALADRPLSRAKPPPEGHDGPAGTGIRPGEGALRQTVETIAEGRLPVNFTDRNPPSRPFFLTGKQLARITETSVRAPAGARLDRSPTPS
jgi:hypothetical protein